MSGAAVHDVRQSTDARPDEAARRRAAVELIRAHDRPLRWTARRYSICADDAEDAYQRGIEILLSKAPTAEVRQLLPWARTVIKHEALAIRKSRERTLGAPAGAYDPGRDEEDWVQLIPADEDGPDELAVRRERVARSKEALSLLKPAELKALTQLAEGFSYAEIGAMNQWTRTKVNRCLSEGRARFRSAFRESEDGERCAEFVPLLSARSDNELKPDQLGDLENHLAVCGHCRATLRTYKAAPKAAAALAPAVPVTAGLWERIQELAISAQLRLQGLGGNSESTFQSALASGGTRGAGVAVAAKLAALCAGTAGTAAVCAVTGVIPGAALLPTSDGREAADRPTQRAPQIERVHSTAPPASTEPPAASTAPEKEPIDPIPTKEEDPVNESPSSPTPAPQPTPMETEFTPEVAGAPATYSAPPPVQAPTNPTSPPVTNGGGEFAP